jgi:hypothetical protein
MIYRRLWLLFSRARANHTMASHGPSPAEYGASFRVWLTRIVGGIEGSSICRPTAQADCGLEWGSKNLPEAHAYAHLYMPRIPHAVCRMEARNSCTCYYLEIPSILYCGRPIRDGRQSRGRGKEGGYGGVPCEWGGLGAAFANANVGSGRCQAPCLKRTGSTSTAGGNIVWKFWLSRSLTVSLSK